MKLYMHPAACSLSPHILCRELGIPIELVEVDRKTHETASGGDFYEINGNGYVPVLELDDGDTLTEGPAIVQYLAELRPGSDLLPEAGTMQRIRVQSWLNFITSELHKPMAMLFAPAYQPARDALASHVNKRLGWLSGQLKGPFLIGETFTVADGYLFVCLNWSPWIGIDLSQWPALQNFMARVGARSAVQEALKAEGLVPNRADGIFYAPRALVTQSKRTQEEARP
ncbi:MAG: glutathione S-transferase N-terminal domain-containing protein [Rhodomicrobiaceae bacterium]